MNQPEKTLRFHYQTSERKQWSCIENKCEESVTKCNNNICDTTKNQFQSNNYKPEATKIEKPPAEILNLPEGIDFSQFPIIEVDNSGLIELLKSGKNFTYYWSNSKYIDKKCLGHVCTITTTSCLNGKCDEKIYTEKI